MLKMNNKNQVDFALMLYLINKINKQRIMQKSAFKEFDCVYFIR